MTKVDSLTETIEKLTSEERKELMKRLLEKMNSSDIKILFEKIKDNEELMSMLRASESTFSDWLNEEDSVYDSL